MVIIQLDPEKYVFDIKNLVVVTINDERSYNGEPLYKRPKGFRLSNIPEYLDEDDGHTDISRKNFKLPSEFPSE